jgi:hypothetical protein
MSSTLPGRCPQRPYYRFYYGRPRIVVEKGGAGLQPIKIG